MKLFYGIAIDRFTGTRAICSVATSKEEASAKAWDDLTQARVERANIEGTLPGDLQPIAERFNLRIVSCESLDESSAATDAKARAHLVSAAAIDFEAYRAPAEILKTYQGADPADTKSLCIINGTVVRFFRPLLDGEEDTAANAVNFSGAVTIFGVAHHVIFMRVETRDYTQQAASDPYHRFNNFSEYDGDGSDGPYQTFEIAGIEGEYVALLTPFCE